MPQVSIIIINYNTFRLSCDCIESVYQYTRGVSFEIILVDNASTECDPGGFPDRFPDIKLVRNPQNSGFASGNNLGIAAATGEVLLLLNSDTYLREDAISKSYDYFRSLERPGAMTIHMVYENGKYQKPARKFRTLSSELLDLFPPLLKLLPYRKRAELMLNQYFKGDFNTRVDWCNGAYFMLCKDTLQDLPGRKLDDRYFMYGEDQLWCYQMIQAGYINYYFAGASIVHIGSASTSRSKKKSLFDLMHRRTVEFYSMMTRNRLKIALFSAIVKLKYNIAYYFNLG